MTPSPLLLLIREHVFTKDFEVRFVSREGQHDQICVESVNDVTSVWVVRFRVGTLSTDEIHNLVFSFSRYRCIRDDDLQLSTKTISFPVERAREKREERSRVKNSHLPIQDPRSTFS